ncbi:alpha/beta hydrolase-fold protein [Caulifigura coniformis]|uniref:alpha/beta hydrolase-fold protein n=1 Tax=Caulifigura coniformis TaxID=2527983 RepID=UPI0018D2337A|nr:alpha/beta hydrolase-fold protein [Caulifigura coniformis]
MYFSRSEEPRRGPNWFRPEPMLAMDVENLPPGQSVELRAPESKDRPGDVQRPATLVFPKGLDARSLAGLKAQAVIRFNPLDREVGTGTGNGFSAAAVVPGGEGPMELVVDRTVGAAAIADTGWTKVFKVPSRLLTEFHGRPVELVAAVQLPPSYGTSPERRYPVIFEVPGFGGALRHGMKGTPYSPATGNGVEFIHVFLDPNCPLGHHVFADSENNGPVGRALVEEFLPALDLKFRTIASPAARFLTGHSSGGWSSLWLQVTYPDVFNGTWSTAPDPVDFRDFQRIDLSRVGENMYVDPAGARRPLARVGGKPILWYDDFARMEDVLGPGGQLHSFEAVFSPRGSDGRPRLIWERETGAVDAAVAETWKRYDIRLILEENWATLGPKLAGKLHVFMGDQDTFYLEGATKLLKGSLEKLGSDAVVEIHPGADHSTLMTEQLKARIPREMSERFLRMMPQDGAGNPIGAGR